MSSALLLCVLQAAPSLPERLSDAHSRVGLLENAALLAAAEDAAGTRRSRMARLDERLRQAPSGWPVSAIIGASVSFSVTGAMAATSLVLMFMFTGAEGAGVVVGTIVALVGVLPLAAAIVFLVIGVSTANQRQHALDRLREERSALVDQEGHSFLVPAGHTPGFVLARF